MPIFHRGEQIKMIEKKDLINLYSIIEELIPRKNENEIEDMDLFNFSLYVGDPNIAPGGYKTLEILSDYVDKDKINKILDVGSNSGHSTFILELLFGCQVVGIDIRKDMISLSNIISEKLNYNSTFELMDARDLSYKDEEFSMVVTSGSIAFIENNIENAISEMSRVLSKDGYLIDTCISYIESPPEEIVNEASSSLESNIPILTKNEYIKMYENKGLYLFNSINIDNKSDDAQDIDKIIKYVIDREQRLRDSQSLKRNNIENVIKNKLEKLLRSFKENDKYTSSDILIFKKENE